jgi:hypothetical protein
VFVFYSDQLSELNGQTRHINILKRHLNNHSTFQRVSCDFIIATKYLYYIK